MTIPDREPDDDGQPGAGQPGVRAWLQNAGLAALRQIALTVPGGGIPPDRPRREEEPGDD